MVSEGVIVGPIQPPEEEEQAKDPKAAGGKGAAGAAAEEPKAPKLTSEMLEGQKMEHFLSMQDKDLY